MDPVPLPVPAPIPVICDRCGARGRAGDELFAAFGDLLDFKPVPRRRRADGWTPEAQRVFVAALALTGSERQAAHAAGKAQYGVTQLKRAKGNEGFLAACDMAMALYEAEQSRRLSEGLLAAASYAGHRHVPVPAAWSGAATRRPAPRGRRRHRGQSGMRGLPDPDFTGLKTPEEEARDRKQLLRVLLEKYAIKLKGEREARLRGEIVAADFYLRQLTHIEVMLDVVAGSDADAGGLTILREAQLDGHGLLRIAQTRMSKLLDDARHLYWIQQGDPPRPHVPPEHVLQLQDGFATEYGEPDPGLQPGYREKKREITEQMQRDAEAQVEWEAKARQDYESRRDNAGDP